ncbi:MAG TPA: rod shape-determining protein MreD [Candidatus Kapabacteria bacterium]|nr:rod shape-determining protein MreD [Candidatus Kapabacteria bacterium]
MISPVSLMRYAAVALLLVLVQLNLGVVAVDEVTPDLLVIFAVYIALREGQFAGEIAGFIIGLLFDFISSDIMGTNALSKMIAAFVAGYFFNEQLTTHEAIGTFRFLGIVALAALVHNVIYYFFYVQPTDLSFWSFFGRAGVASALYTTVIAVFVMLVAARKKTWSEI